MGALPNKSAPTSTPPIHPPPPSSTQTPNFHNNIANPSPTIKQPRLRASCDGCFLAKVKCTKSRPVCSRCLAVGLVCQYSPSSRSSSSSGKTRDMENGRKCGRRRRTGGTAVLASTMSEESCAWLAQQGGLSWAGVDAAGYGKGQEFEWDLSSSLAVFDQNFLNPSLASETWMTPESQGWMEFAFENELNGDACWQTMREVNSPFSIGSSEVDENVGGGFGVNQGQWVG